MPVSQYTAYLSNHTTPTDITGQDGLSVITENVVALEPDLVLAGNITNREIVDQLRTANITVYHFPTATRLGDIVQNIKTAGVLTGECAGAATRVAWMNQELATVHAATADQPKPLVFLAMGDGWTAGTETFQHEILVHAGAENLAARANITGWNVISEEIVHTEDPQWIVYSDTFDEPPLRAGDRLTTAYESNQTIAVNAHYLNQPGPRVIIVITELARQFHPNAINQSESQQQTNQSLTTTPGSPALPQPGFTLLATLLAVILFVTYWTRRNP
jgi:iron complex transport system substrate-binding protein